MTWYLEALSMPIRIDAQTNPLPAILLFGVVCALLWFAVASARHRETRRAAKEQDLSGWRSRQPPRY